MGNPLGTRNGLSRLRYKITERPPNDHRTTTERSPPSLPLYPSGVRGRTLAFGDRPSRRTPGWWGFSWAFGERDLSPTQAPTENQTGGHGRGPVLARNGGGGRERRSARHGH